MGEVVQFPSKGPYEEWEYIYIEQPTQMVKDFGKYKPKSLGFDTESTGLHIKKDMPFLMQVGFKRTIYMFDPDNKHCMNMFFYLCSRVNYVFAHNLKYDLHMLANQGYQKEVESIKVWCDSQTVMRLTLEAKSPREGGHNLKLKDLGVSFIHPYANNSEQLIKAEMKKLNAERTKILSAALKQFDHPTEKVLKYFRKDTNKSTTSKWASDNPDNSYMKWIPKKWTLGLVEAFIKDITNDLEDLPTEVREVWETWQIEYPEPTYADVDREVMKQYAGEDVATMMMLIEKSFPTLVERKQMPILKREMKLQLPTFRMERQGLPVDRNYLKRSQYHVKEYIRELRKELMELVGERVTVNQHDRIKQIFNDKFDILLESSDKQAMKQVIANFEGPPQRFAILINKLRTCEKWYSTYIVKILRDSAYDGRAYTQINLNGAISGRMSSDFQQFPKDPLKTLEGHELYHPRQAILVDEKTCYLDYSQIELVGQAHYTILVSGGDMNLCRAFMPFKCKHYQTGETFWYKSKEGRNRWNELQPVTNDSVWLLEDGTPWKRTDLHSLTTSKAFPHIDPESEEFKYVYRPKGKMTNFSSNYGGKAGALVGGIGCSWEEAEMLVNGYAEAYPEVIAYQNEIQRVHGLRGYVQNHYGRRYYLRDNRDAYKLANYVVQGTCADAIKDAIIQMDEYLLDKQTKMLLPVHDEVQFKTVAGEEHVIERCRQIMEEAFDWCLVPAIADVEVSYTNWREKKEVA